MAGNIKINSSSGGSVTLTATETAADRILTLPGTAGTLATMDSLTGGLNLPSGTTAQRPASPVAGMMRYNSTTNSVELYNGSAWVNSGNYIISYLAVAGGGGGGGNLSGGGGAGGYKTGTAGLIGGTVYTITVGGGGTGSPASTRGSTNGNISSISFIATDVIGGGAGGTQLFDGQAGGSGGGGAWTNGTLPAGGVSVGQGFAGGRTVTVGNLGGGGGGSSAVGGNASSFTVPGNGGAGTSNSITGTPVTYAGGGGGGGGNAGGAGGTGGAGGGGAGGVNGSNGVAGTVNTGGGGGGGGYSGGTGGAGGSGVVILSIPTSNYSGIITGSPTITTSGSNTVIKFTSSGSYTA
jgi:hypothetical protein